MTISPKKMTLESGHTITKTETIYGNVYTLRSEEGYLQLETAAYGNDTDKIEACKRTAAL
jgi:hypothetical protein